MRTITTMLLAATLLTGAGLGVVAQTGEEAKPDLVPTDLDPQPSDPVEGDDVTVTATIANDGDADADAFNVTFLVDGEQLGENRTVDELRFGDQAEVTSDNWTAETGDHDVRVIVDPHEDVDEADEDNNERDESLAVAEAQVDLFVTELGWQPSEPVEGDQLTFEATVENQGNVASNATELRFFLDDNAFGDDVDVPALAPAENATVTSQNWSALEGNHDVSAFVDPTRDVDEADEDDNEAADVVTVEPDEANLHVADISLDAENPEPGDNVTFTATIENDGNDLAENATLVIELDGEQLANATIDALAPGEQTGMRTPEWNASEGEHTVRAEADVRGNVTEIDETDNAGQHSFTVSALADLKPVELDVPEDADEEELVTFEATLANTGGETAENVSLAFRLDGEEISHATVASLAPGEETTVESDAWNATEGEHTLLVVADADGNVTEADEDDNEATRTFTVAGHEHDHEGEDGEDTVTICHVPPGNPSAQHTIEVGEPGAENHIERHEGDHRGPCEE